MKVQNLNKRQAQQMLYLSIFDFTLKYIPETKIQKADGLSKRLDQKIGVEKNNENQKSKQLEERMKRQLEYRENEEDRS